jgi:prevent-host-death family protein
MFGFETFEERVVEGDCIECHSKPLGEYGKPSLKVNKTKIDRLAVVIHICITMKTATVRDLRNRFARVASWIAEGEPVEITKSGKPFARLLPAVPQKPRRFKMPDIMARLNRDFGDSSYDATEVARGLAASRGDLS